MTALPASLEDFAGLCRSHLGPASVGATDNALFVVFGERLVQVNLDRDSRRVVIWTELGWPETGQVSALEEASFRFSSQSFLADGQVLALNRAANLVVLGLSREEGILQHYAALKLLDLVADTARVADEALAAAARETR